MCAPVALHITVSALKGGVGKSTTVLNLATCLHRDGYRVLVIDADRQGTCRSWAEIASEAGHAGPAVVALGAAALRRDLPGLAQGYDVVVIDSPPQAGPEVRSAMLVADVIVIPTTPGAADAWALQTTLDVLAEVRALRPEVKAAVLLNRADRTRLTKAVREAAAGLGLPLLGAEMTVRVTYGEATLAGQGVVTYAPSSPAAKEIEHLTAAVLAAVRGTDEQATPDREPEPQAAAAPDTSKNRRTRGGGKRDGGKGRSSPAVVAATDPGQLPLAALGAHDSNRAPGTGSGGASPLSSTPGPDTSAEPASGTRARSASRKGRRGTGG